MSDSDGELYCRMMESRGRDGERDRFLATPTPISRYRRIAAIVDDLWNQAAQARRKGDEGDQRRLEAAAWRIARHLDLLRAQLTPRQQEHLASEALTLLATAFVRGITGRA